MFPILYIFLIACSDIAVPVTAVQPPVGWVINAWNTSVWTYQYTVEYDEYA